MRCGAAHVKMTYGRPVLGPTGRRTQEEKLLESQLALKDVAFGEAETPLDIERCEDLPVQNDVAQIRRVLGERVDHRVPELFPFLVPGSFFEMIGRVLDKARHHMLAW